MTLTAEQSSNKARYEAATTAEIIDIIRIAMGEGCIRPCHVFDAVDELICRIQSLENRQKRNCDLYANAGAAWDAYDEWVESYRNNGKTPPFNEFGWLFAPAAERKGECDGG